MATAEPLNVLLLQLPVPNNPRAHIPLAAGYLKAYAATEGLLDQVAIEIMPRSVADRGGDALIVDEIVRLSWLQEVETFAMPYGMKKCCGVCRMPPRPRISRS